MKKAVELPKGLSKIISNQELANQKNWYPRVTIAYAQSIDGSIAAVPGKPLIISNSASKRITHALRAKHQGILIGINTLLADDPKLDVRRVPGVDPQPIILDNQLRFPLNARLLKMKMPPWIMTSSDVSEERKSALIQAGARVLQPSQGRVNLSDALHVLRNEGIKSVMVEGGAQIITAFLMTKLVDLMIITVSPMLVGGLHVITELLVEPGGVETGTVFPRLDLFGVENIEGDLLIWGCPLWDAE